jgi:hypothetical protein
VKSLKRTGLIWKTWKEQEFHEKPERDRTSLKSLKETGQNFCEKPEENRTSLKSLEGIGRLWKA